jgi:hypothetical protein
MLASPEGGMHVVLSSDSGFRVKLKAVPAIGNCWVREIIVRVVFGVKLRVAVDSRRSVKANMVRSASEGFAYSGGCEAEWVMV